MPGYVSLDPEVDAVVDMKIGPNIRTRTFNEATGLSMKSTYKDRISIDNDRIQELRKAVFPTAFNTTTIVGVKPYLQALEIVLRCSIELRQALWSSRTPTL